MSLSLSDPSAPERLLGMNERTILTTTQIQNTMLYRILTVDDRKDTDPQAHLLAMKCLRRLMTEALFESFVSLAKAQGLNERSEGLPNAGRVMLTWDRMSPQCEDTTTSGWEEFARAIEIMLVIAIENANQSSKARG